MPDPKPEPAVNKQELDEAVRDMLSVTSEELPEELQSSDEPGNAPN